MREKEKRMHMQRKYDKLAKYSKLIWIEIITRLLKAITSLDKVG